MWRNIRARPEKKFDEKEEWKMIPETQNKYAVSNNGYVKNLKSGRVLAFGNKGKYLSVNIQTLLFGI